MNKTTIMEIGKTAWGKAIAVLLAVVLSLSAFTTVSIAYAMDHDGVSTEASEPEEGTLTPASVDPDITDEFESTEVTPESAEPEVVPDPEPASPEPETPETPAVNEETPAANEETPQAVVDFMNAVDALDRYMATEGYDEEQANALGQAAMDAYDALEAAGLEDYEGVQAKLARLMDLAERITGGVKTMSASLSVPSWCTSEDLGDQVFQPSAELIANHPDLTVQGVEPGELATSVIDKNNATYLFSHAQIFTEMPEKNNRYKVIKKEAGVFKIKYDDKNDKWYYKATSESDWAQVPAGNMVFCYNADQLSLSLDGQNVGINAKDWPYTETEWTTGGGDVKYYSTSAVVIYQLYGENGNKVGDQKRTYFTGFSWEKPNYSVDVPRGYEAEIKINYMTGGPSYANNKGNKFTSYTSPSNWSQVTNNQPANLPLSYENFTLAQTCNNKNVGLNGFADNTRTAFVAIKLTKLPTYTVTYKDGVADKEIFADTSYGDLLKGDSTPALNIDDAIMDPESLSNLYPGHRFTGWNPEKTGKVNGNATYVAQWETLSYAYTVNYLEKDTDKKLAESVTGQAAFDTEFTGSAADITGYKLVEDSEATITQTIVDGENVINFYYEKDNDQTQPTEYTVKHMVEGVEMATDTYTATAWINDNPAMIEVAEATLEPNTYDGYVYTEDMSIEGNYDAEKGEAETGTVFTLNYERGTYPYTVEYYYNDGEEPGEAPEGATTGGEAIYGASVEITPDDEVIVDGDHYVLTSTEHEIESLSYNDDENVIKVFYAIDNVIDPDNDKNGDKPGDGIPDMYQATILYTSADDAQGTVTGETTKVVTLMDEDGAYVKEAAVTPGLEGVVVTPAEDYNANGWDADPEAEIVAEGFGKYTYTAQWAEIPGAPVTPAGPDTPVTPAGPDAPVTPTPAPATPAAPAAPAPAAPAAAAAPAVVALDDAANPLAAADEVIDDDETPMSAFDDVHCWVHWLMIIGMVLTAIYCVAVALRRKNFTDNNIDFEERVLNKDTKSERVYIPGGVHQAVR